MKIILSDGKSKSLRSCKVWEHRRVSRPWLFWLGSAWPHIQVWTGWNEIKLPGLPQQIPDALAWGSMSGLETLFWLEVDSGHGSLEEIRKKTRLRFMQAVNYAHERESWGWLGSDWVCNAARLAFVNLPENVVVTIGNWQELGHLPMTEWGRVEW